MCRFMMSCRNSSIVWLRCIIYYMYMITYLCGGEVDEAGEVFSLGRTQVLLLLKPPLQFVNLKQIRTFI